MIRPIMSNNINYNSRFPHQQTGVNVLLLQGYELKWMTQHKRHAARKLKIEGSLADSLRLTSTFVIEHYGTIFEII